jgi:hypothetical protein
VELTAMARPHRTARRPSPVWGFREALRLWRLVIACWVVAWLAVAPALLLVRRMVFPGLAALPPDPGAVTAGDVALIVMEGVRRAAAPLGLAVASGAVVLWAWAVLWHAGVVAWQMWTGGRRVRLGEVLGLGMVAWWRYARLSMTALLALAAALAGLWIPLWSGIEAAFTGMDEGRLMWLLAAGIVVTKLVAIVVWIATLHGAWLLGLPERRSAALAWLRGLWTSARMPLSSVGAWLVWLVPAMAVSALPPVVGILFEGSRGGPVLIGVELLASLARAFCWIGLFCSFAPVTGIVGVPEEELEPAAAVPKKGDSELDLAGDEEPRLAELDVEL